MITLTPRPPHVRPTADAEEWRWEGDTLESRVTCLRKAVSDPRMRACSISTNNEDEKSMIQLTIHALFVEIVI